MLAAGTTVAGAPAITAATANLRVRYRAHPPPPSGRCPCMDAATRPGAAARRAGRSRWIGFAGRAGLAAQGICFGIIGLLSIELAAGGGGKTTDPQGALNALARGGWTRALLVLLCVGFAGYTVWRFAQAILDRGDMGGGISGYFRRGIQLVQGISYAFLTFGAAKTVAGAGSRAGGEKRAAAGILGWPAGQEIVGLVAAVLAVTAGVLVYWALSRRFRESLATEQMGKRTEQVTDAAGIVGLLALAVVCAIIGWFLMKAAVEFDQSSPVGIGGALAKVADAAYGSWLLGITAAGLLVFAAFDLIQARYHKA
jgi:Domain of Unknown Function (DUF1206)